MSAREVDINPNKDVGLKLPMTRSNKTGDFTTTKNSTQQAVHNISNLLLELKNKYAFHTGSKVNKNAPLGCNKIISGSATWSESTLI